MDRQFYLDLAARKLAMPIGAHLVLHEQPNHEAVRMDGAALGKVVAEAARRFKTPLAFPLMDLQIEKEDMMTILGVPAAEIAQHHFAEDGPDAETYARLLAALDTAPATPRMRVTAEAIAAVAQAGDLIPLGMCIGPFSLFTKLHADPISLVYAAAMADDEDEEAAQVFRTLEMATAAILRSLRLQIAAGAKAICVCEPACNLVYLSPKQLELYPEMLERFVMRYNRQIKALLDAHDVDLVFHDCGELHESMIRAFGTLDPALLSLGSSVRLWDVAPLIPARTVLFGNLPSKKFYSDTEYPATQVELDATNLRLKMAATGHPFILGSECDVLCVHGHEHTIWNKVHAFLGR